jgi:hypothetical protein
MAASYKLQLVKTEQLLQKHQPSFDASAAIIKLQTRDVQLQNNSKQAASCHAPWVYRT